MENKYLTQITMLLKQIHPNLSKKYKLEFKNCFGAVAGYVDDKLFITCGKYGVALKLPKEILDELFQEKDVKHLRYFPKGHIKKEYAVLPRRILENKRQFEKLVDKSIRE